MNTRPPCPAARQDAGEMRNTLPRVRLFLNQGARMMEWSDQCKTTQIDDAGGNCERPYLAKISDLAGETARIGDYIETFIDRCRGGVSLDVAKGVGATDAPTGHFANLDRLAENLSRVDKLARELRTIG